MFDFPASPSVGTIYSPAGGPTWQWNGTTWLATAPSGLVPEAPVDGQNYVRRNGVWVLAPGTAEAKNRIVNPCFQIQQDATMGTGYVADQWVASTTIATATFLRGTDTTPFGSKYNIRLLHTTPKPSLAAADFHGFGQNVEGIRISDFQWGTAAARQVVVRFAVWSTVAGTFNVSLMNGPAVSRSYVDTFTISAGELNTYAYKTLVIPGDVTGTWNRDTSLGLTLYVTFALGSTYTTATRGWQAGEKYGLTTSTNGVASAATFYLYDVGLYLDPQNTGVAPPWQMPDEAQELTACMRYWNNLGGGPVIVDTNLVATSLVYPVPMRTVPAVTGGGAGFAAGASSAKSAQFYQTARNYQTIILNARM